MKLPSANERMKNRLKLPAVNFRDTKDKELRRDRREEIYMDDTVHCKA